ncbi:MAG: DUF4366 domain-containing protein [Clostridia bacterium]|nr:DUF4366 domain-containing protein [Clostridia bacterium]
MTKNRNTRIAALILAALLSMFLLPLAAFADGGDYYAYELPPGEGNPDAQTGDWIIDETPSDEPDTESPEDESSFGDFSFENLFGGLLSAFTPDGNLTLVDDFSFLTEDEDGNTEGKQFLTVQTKAGNTFFIVIDRARESENTYFLNLVDEADLLSLMDEPPAEKAAPVCTCTDHCTVGHIDTSCPVCAADMMACLGTDPEPEPEPEEVVIPPEPEPEPLKKDGMENTMRIVGAVGLLAVAAVVLLIVFRGKNRKQTLRHEEPEEEMEFQPYQEEEQTESGDDT